MVQWQAHRGGGGVERPDNTIVSFLYGWDLGGIAERQATGVPAVGLQPEQKGTSSYSSST